MSKLPISGQISWQLAFSLSAVIVAIVVVVIFLRVETWPARTARQSTAELERLGKDLRAAFIDIAHLQPRITINNRVYMEQSAPVNGLAAEAEHTLQRQLAERLHTPQQLRLSFKDATPNKEK